MAEVWTSPRLSPQYYPVTFTVLWGAYRLWGDWAAGYHAANVLIHAGSAVLLWPVLRRLGVGGAWAAAALFAVHPVVVESVAWVTEIKNVLGLHLALWSLWWYVRFRPFTWVAAGAGVGAGSRRAYGGAPVLFVAALLAKSVTAVLPLVILLLAWWRGGGRVSWRRDVVPLVPLVVAGVLAGVHTAWLEVGHVGARRGMGIAGCEPARGRGAGDLVLRGEVGVAAPADVRVRAMGHARRRGSG